MILVNTGRDPTETNHNDRTEGRVLGCPKDYFESILGTHHLLQGNPVDLRFNLMEFNHLQHIVISGAHGTFIAQIQRNATDVNLVHDFRGAQLQDHWITDLLRSLDRTEGQEAAYGVLGQNRDAAVILGAARYLALTDGRRERGDAQTIVDLLRGRPDAASPRGEVGAALIDRCLKVLQPTSVTSDDTNMVRGPHRPSLESMLDSRGTARHDTTCENDRRGWGATTVAGRGYSLHCVHCTRACYEKSSSCSSLS